MADLHEKAVSQRNLLERLGAKIPGFKGYMEKETRRDADKIQRDFVADELFGQKAQIKRALDDAIMGGDLDGIMPYEKLMGRIDVVAQKIKNAPRGYSGIFDTIKIGEDQLARIYEFDVSLTEGAEEVAAKVGQLGSADKERKQVLVREATDLVNKLEEYFSRREEILRKG